MTTSDLPERLRALAEHITCWDHPITAKQDCLDAAREIERLQGIVDDTALEIIRLRDIIQPAIRRL